MINRIREFREDAGLTQDELGELVGTSFQQISRLESGGRKLSQSWMERLGAALKVRPSALIEDGPLALLKAKIISNRPNEIDEEELLGLWREMEFETKVALMVVARAITRRRPLSATTGRARKPVNTVNRKSA